MAPAISLYLSTFIKPYIIKNSIKDCQGVRAGAIGVSVYQCPGPGTEPGTKWREADIQRAKRSTQNMKVFLLSS